MPEETSLGRIDISPRAVASLVGQTVIECYGVVGMASKNLTSSLVGVLQRDSRRGVEVRLEDGEIIIDLYVVIEYGTKVSTVAHNIMRSVKFNVEKALGVPVKQVNVHVQGLRVSEM